MIDSAELSEPAPSCFYTCLFFLPYILYWILPYYILKSNIYSCMVSTHSRFNWVELHIYQQFWSNYHKKIYILQWLWMQDRGDGTPTAMRSLHTACLYFAALPVGRSQACQSSRPTASHIEDEGRAEAESRVSLNKQLSAASKNISAEQSSWLRPQFFTQQRANRGGTFKGAAVLLSEVQVRDVFLWQSSQWPPEYSHVLKEAFFSGFLTFLHNLSNL